MALQGMGGGRENVTLISQEAYMQKWEYVIVAEKTVESDRGPLTVYAINGKPIEPWTNDLPRVANFLGEQGWELAAAHPIHAANSAILIFKRPKS